MVTQSAGNQHLDAANCGRSQEDLVVSSGISNQLLGVCFWHPLRYHGHHPNGRLLQRLVGRLKGTAWRQDGVSRHLKQLEYRHFEALRCRA